MSERQGFDPSLESMAKKTEDAALHAGKETFKPGGHTSNPLENTAKKTGEVTLHAGKTAFKPVRNPIEKPGVDKSPEKKEQPQPSMTVSAARPLAGLMPSFTRLPGNCWIRRAANGSWPACWFAPCSVAPSYRLSSI